MKELYNIKVETSKNENMILFNITKLKLNSLYGKIPLNTKVKLGRGEKCITI